MESYDEILTQFEPLIKKMIKRFSFVDVYDELYQVGRIALWEAYERYDPEKGPFPAFARSYLNGRFLQLVNKPRYETLEATEQVLTNMCQYEVPYLESFILEEILSNLSKRERLFVEYVFIQRCSQKDLAQLEGVSYETVRSWRKSALAKLRIKGKTMYTI